jgi:hypothetical protein
VSSCAPCGAHEIIAGCAWLIESLSWLLAPLYGQVLDKFTSPLAALELLTPLWLLIMGAKDRSLAD